MKLTYLHHSGFLLETDSVSILFDYYKGTLPAIAPGKPLYIMTSHAHDDHYSKKIYEIASTHLQSGAKTILILSDDIREGDVPKNLQDHTAFLAPHEHWNDEALRVFTLLSNDQGLAFSIHVIDGERHRNVFFAGDLNAWNWDGDEEDMALIRIYHEELELIKDYEYDLAFLPLDPRLKENETQGITDFFDVCKCNAMKVAPMHCWGDYAIIDRAKALKDAHPYMERLLTIRKDGDVFEL